MGQLRRPQRFSSIRWYNNNTELGNLKAAYYIAVQNVPHKREEAAARYASSIAETEPKEALKVAEKDCPSILPEIFEKAYSGYLKKSYVGDVLRCVSDYLDHPVLGERAHEIMAQVVPNCLEMKLKAYEETFEKEAQADDTLAKKNEIIKRERLEDEILDLYKRHSEFIQTSEGNTTYLNNPAYELRMIRQRMTE